MTVHERFGYSSLSDLSKAVETIGCSLPLAVTLDLLRTPIRLHDKVIPNRIAAQPMEGCDGTQDGRPGELTRRRYRRFAESGAGLIWFEATAVVSEGRANPRQLYLSKETAGDFAELSDNLHRDTVNKFGSENKPCTVLQLTHSGRYSRPCDAPSPILAVHNPHLEKNLSDSARIITDSELEALEDTYAEAASRALECGFDAVDVKSCHRYLISELLSAHTREGDYGGSFENRTRFLLNIIDKIKRKTAGELGITVRLNMYDAIPYPYGWGVDRSDHRIPDLTEPLKLVGILNEKGVGMINITAGNPYFNPHVNRPFDIGPYVPPEHSLTGVSRMLNIARTVKDSFPDMIVISSGVSWLREFGANVAAGGIEDGWFDMAGFGRQFFAYPGFPADVFTQGRMNRKQCCIACGKCSELMRFGATSGCVIHDRDVYLPIYREACKGQPSLVGKTVAEHV